MVFPGMRRCLAPMAAAILLAGCQATAPQLEEVAAESGEQQPGPPADTAQQDVAADFRYGGELEVVGVALTEIEHPVLEEFGPLYVPSEYADLAVVPRSLRQPVTMWRDANGDGEPEWTVNHELLFDASFRNADGGQQFWTGLIACREGDCGYLSENPQEYAGVFLSYEDNLLRGDPGLVAARTGSPSSRFLPNSWFTEQNLVCLQANYRQGADGGTYTSCGAGIVVEGRPYILLTTSADGMIASDALIIQAINAAVMQRLPPAGAG